ncbi:hypothetical protein J5583_06770 [Streptococcus suis]|uniref:hypothetical protein n=1 Tax=Streptococcus suis TaxID=1307 RepID=UPI001ABDE672|nr:hypothetical protein [Streptococcus suis]MBO4109863.1 hypothetical protein [Streptococcus suis]
MTIIELKNCNIINMYNSHTDEYYDDDYYGCPTCGGASVPDTFILEIVTDKFENETIAFYEEEAKNALRNFLPWVLRNKDKFKDVSFSEFVNGKVQELAMEEIDEINK